MTARDGEGDGTTYTEREFAMILHKASELAPTGPASTSAGSGLSLAEMKAIAADVGIAPELVERAARLLPAGGGESRLDRLMGGPLRHRRDFLVESELTDRQASRLLSAIRAAAEQHGKGTASATGVTWSSTGEASRMFVAAHPERGGTRVRIGVDRSGGLLLTGFLNLTGGIVLASVVGAILDPDSLAVGASILGGGVAAGLASWRTAWSATSRRIRKRVDALVESIGTSVEDPSSGSSGEP